MDSLSRFYTSLILSAALCVSPLLGSVRVAVAAGPISIDSLSDKAKNEIAGEVEFAAGEIQGSINGVISPAVDQITGGLDQLGGLSNLLSGVGSISELGQLANLQGLGNQHLSSLFNTSGVFNQLPGLSIISSLFPSGTNLFGGLLSGGGLGGGFMNNLLSGMSLGSMTKFFKSFDLSKIAPGLFAIILLAKAASGGMKAFNSMAGKVSSCKSGQCSQSGGCGSGTCGSGGSGFSCSGGSCSVDFGGSGGGGVFDFDSGGGESVFDFDSGASRMTQAGILGECEGITDPAELIACLEQLSGDDDDDDITEKRPRRKQIRKLKCPKRKFVEDGFRRRDAGKLSRVCKALKQRIKHFKIVVESVNFNYTGEDDRMLGEVVADADAWAADVDEFVASMSAKYGF